MGDSFGMARALSRVLEVAGWVVIVGAGALALSRVNDSDFAPAITLGLGMVFGGVLMIVMAQLMRATVATAENTARLVVSAERLLAANASEAGALRRGPSASKIVKKVEGHTITREDGGYGVDGHVFPNLGQAETHARRNPKP